MRFVTQIFLPLLVFALPAFGAEREAIVSIPDQRIAIVENGFPIAHFAVSTSRYGVGDSFESFATPLGYMEVAGKVGDGAPIGAVFHHRRWTGEVLRPNTPGRDPIVTRILWLRGLETQNSNAFSRNIYIHGTTAESMIGRPASFGCIRMRSRDVVQLFDMLPVGSMVQVTRKSLPRALAETAEIWHSGLGSLDSSRIAWEGRN
jgi:lipoprotein-anchoring transpeptidase ErfK/SrfK